MTSTGRVPRILRSPKSAWIDLRAIERNLGDLPGVRKQCQYTVKHRAIWRIQIAGVLPGDVLQDIAERFYIFNRPLRRPVYRSMTSAFSRCDGMLRLQSPAGDLCEGLPVALSHSAVDRLAELLFDLHLTLDSNWPRADRFSSVMDSMGGT